MAGTSSSFQGSRPNLRCASYIPATVPGTPTERWPVSDELIALPAVSTYMSRVARVGAVSRKSSAPTVPSCIRVTMNPPPPMLPATGWTTASANATATAASTALPPRRSTSTPTSLARGCDVTTMACSPVTGATRGRQAGRNEGTTRRPLLHRGPRGGVDRRGRDGRRNGVEHAGGHGDRLRRLDAAAARQHQQAENEGSAHLELCTLTRVRVNV